MAPKKKSTTESTPSFSYEEIKQKAHEIYLERVKKGIHGTPEGDWHKAIEELTRQHKSKK